MKSYPRLCFNLKEQRNARQTSPAEARLWSMGTGCALPLIVAKQIVGLYLWWASWCHWRHMICMIHRKDDSYDKSIMFYSTKSIVCSAVHIRISWNWQCASNSHSCTSHQLCTLIRKHYKLLTTGQSCFTLENLLVTPQREPKTRAQICVFPPPAHSDRCYTPRCILHLEKTPTRQHQLSGLSEKNCERWLMTMVFCHLV